MASSFVTQPSDIVAPETQPRGLVEVVRPIQFGTIAEEYLKYKESVTAVNRRGYDAVLAALAHREKYAEGEIDLSGKTILDIGCGPGNFSRELARHGANVIGVDKEAEMISLARDKTPINMFPTTVRFKKIEGNADFGWPPNTVDGAVATFCFCTIPTFEQVEDNLRSAHQAIKDGGRLAIMHANYAEAQGQNFGTHRLPSAPNLKQGDPVKLFLINPDGTELALRDFYYPPAAYRESMEAIGFKNVQIQPIAIPDGRRPLIMITGDVRKPDAHTM